MKHRRMLMILGCLAFLIGLAVITLQTRSALVVTASSAPFSSRIALTEAGLASPGSRDLRLQCNIKVAGGLAQCGSQKSSCKNCHEVKGEDPVNTQGDWHTQHAFGDFCEFCHGGNVQAIEKDAAHQGLIEPLGDVEANCSSCHDDYQALTGTYAAALGTTIGAGGGSSQLPSGPEPTPTPQPAPDTSAGAPSGGETVDYVAQYTTGSAAPISTGNVIVGALLVLTVAGGGAFIYWNKKRLQNTERGVQITDAEPKPSEIAIPKSEIEGALSPELAKLLPVLQSLDPRTVRALRVILSDPKRGEELLQSLSVINFAVLEEMKRLDKRELSLLLALASET